jgi:hypothetical protein
MNSKWVMQLAFIGLSLSMSVSQVYGQNPPVNPGAPGFSVLSAYDANGRKIGDVISEVVKKSLAKRSLV